MIDEVALYAMYKSMSGMPVTGEGHCMKTVRHGMGAYLSHLPTPESPYEQAALYRKMVGIE